MRTEASRDNSDGLGSYVQAHDLHGLKTSTAVYGLCLLDNIKETFALIHIRQHLCVSVAWLI